MVRTDEFIKIWNTDLAVYEIAEQLGIKEQSVSVRAVRLRKQGYDLKKKG